MKNKLNYFPYNPFFVLTLIFIIVFLIALVQIGIITYAYEKLGIDGQNVLLILMLSIIGSYINIPVTEIESETRKKSRQIVIYGIRHVIPDFRNTNKTIIAVNVGGALIPVLLSLYLMMKNEIIYQSLAGIFMISLIVYYLSKPVPGLGIAVPVLIPPIAAAIVSFLIPSSSAPALAYVSGTIGTLVGGDIMKLNKIKKLGTPVASIGGAGTFDGIFIIGILAVLLA